MKIKLLIIILISSIITECPDKMVKFLNKEVKGYFKSSKIKGNIKKFRCNYDHDFNIFNMKHKINGSLMFKKKKVRYNMEFTSGLANIFDYNKLNFNLCHQNFKKKIKTRKALFDSLGKFFKHLNMKDIKKSKNGDMKCLNIQKEKNWRKVKKMKKMI